jgi:uncharacterized protein YjbI with pentapeptide repeats
MSTNLHRLTVEQTWQSLEARGEKVPRRKDGTPFVPEAMPSNDDEELGFSFFRNHVLDADYSNLSLPKTYFGRSLLKGVSLRNADLAKSCMCWNDFVECDFSGADLTGCDMRASNFEDCNFVNAVLDKADLRRSNIEGCDFTGASLVGAVADNLNNDLVDALDTTQKEAVDWRKEPGPEPPGG